MQNIYCLSGLGADRQIFEKLNIKGAQLIHIPWVEHGKHDTLPTYAKRLLSAIKEPHPIVLGVSFGGMIGVEIAKLISVKKLIIISSAKGEHEIPHFGSIIRALVLMQVAPAFFYKMPNRFLFERFGAVTDEEKEVLSSILQRSDGHFMSWAMKGIQLWHNDVVPKNVVHIHGTTDKIIPPERIKADHWIKGGEHMMIYNRADEIAAIIEKELA